jgi:hypothetical protein
MKSCLKLLFLIEIASYSICNAVIPPIDVIKDIINEKTESIYSLDVGTEISIKIHYDLSSSQIKERLDLRDSQIEEVTTEAGKIFTSSVSNVGEGIQLNLRAAWNGETTVRSSSSTDGTGRNSLSSKFNVGNFMASCYQMEEIGVPIKHTLGTLDIDSSSIIAVVDTQYYVFNRIRKSGPTTESIRLEEIDYKGKKCILMSLVVDKGLLAKLIKFPIVEHIIDPELDYACVESRFYNQKRGGITKKIVKHYAKNENTGCLLESSEIIKYVRQYHSDEYPYDEADFDKVASIHEVRFTKYKVNQPIVPVPLPIV